MKAKKKTTLSDLERRKARIEGFVEGDRCGREALQTELRRVLGIDYAVARAVDVLYERIEAEARKEASQ